MADAKHTPGPWHVEPQQDGASWEICTEKRGAWIMVLRSTAEATDEERAEDLANAQLMAAAPELLEALRQAHHTTDCLLAKCISLDKNFRPTTSSHWPAMLAINAAIAKASGSAS